MAHRVRYQEKGEKIRQKEQNIEKSENKKLGQTKLSNIFTF